MNITSAKVIPGCISCKNCENICPEIFKVDPKSTVISDKFNQNALKLLMAEKMCPVNVIKVEKEGAYELNFSEATLKSKTYLTPDVVELIFDTQDFEFTPGQYVSLQMRDVRGDFSRSYSIAGATKTSFTLTVKLLEKGRGSSCLRKLGERNWQNMFFKKTKIEYLGAMGDFVLQDTQNKKVMIATGTGLAPMIPMLDALSDDVEKLLVFGVRSEEDLFYVEKLKKYKNLELRLCVSRPTEEHINGERVTDQIHDIEKNDEVYICGNPDMVHEVRETLKSDGHEAEKIFHEDFTLASKPISLTKSVFFEGEIPGLETFHKILIYIGVFGIPLFYYLGLEYGFLGYKIGDKDIYSILFLLTWYAVVFVMLIRPLADIFPKLKILRRMVVLRKGFGIFSASIIVTMLIAKWIQTPATFAAFFTLQGWTFWLSMTSRLSEVTALILLATSNTFSQRVLGIWWKRIQRVAYIYFYSGPIIALQYSDTVLEYYIPMILLPIVWLLAHYRVKLWK
ncbi:ferredoxin [Candidatus Gracilibacteria bacterium]|nr:ferredoxin [Candidatus Gracilibacteria bacterium]